MRLTALLLAAGWTPTEVLTAAPVALAESGGRATIVNTTAPCGKRADGTPAHAIGLMQICTIHLDKGGIAEGLTEDDLKNPLTNARIGKKIYDAEGWSPWETHTNGAWLKYRAKNPDVQTDANPATDGGLIDKLLPGNPVAATRDAAGAVSDAVDKLTTPGTWWEIGKGVFGLWLITLGTAGLVFVVARKAVGSAPVKSAVSVAGRAGGPTGKAISKAAKVIK